ncbi:MAG: pyridoxal phosphate-dependent aminotransferase [Alphaproteobacteria bacterium]|nr:pyridoxal phosphate-dependent aminotransferase [Alphaproteobacteria bacterium]MCL2504707.1 pyridoxal phosphate-dependent aminotransferase [Alphaproteobacteria bacterium]
MVSNYMQNMMQEASLIRKMFEAGAKLKAQYGPENVFDFSIGNPSVPPVKEFKNALKTVASDSGISHGYMPNAGEYSVRNTVATKASEEQKTPIPAENVVMTCGAAGAINIALKALLNPQDEVIVICPYFMEYKFYIENHQGKMAVVQSSADFDLDIEAIEKAITTKTKAIIINSPNNPTGKVYSEQTLRALGQMLEKQPNPIYVISDEPYRHITYGIVVPALFPLYRNSIIATSFSKDMSIPGERIGWLAVNPQAEKAAEIVNASIIANRILGFTNAPALMQKVVALCLDNKIDSNIYLRKRDLFVKLLSDLGYEVSVPEGAFYLFVKSPIEDDKAFCELLLAQNILAVPGKSFGKIGYFRLAYCCDDDTIKNSKQGFKNAIEKAK